MAKAVIIDDARVNAKIVNPTRIVRINDILPFRVRFIPIGVESYGVNNIPGIGIQVIGFSNYIL